MVAYVCVAVAEWLYTCDVKYFNPLVEVDLTET
jgi:hypothetical protein